MARRTQRVPVLSMEAYERMQRMRKMPHVFAEGGGFFEGTDENGNPFRHPLCKQCGRLRATTMHALPPAAERPEPPPRLIVGDRVLALVLATDQEELGTVTSIFVDASGEQIGMQIELDKAKGTSGLFKRSEVRLAPQVPKFTTVEEADAWLEEQARRGF